MRNYSNSTANQPAEEVLAALLWKRVPLHSWQVVQPSALGLLTAAELAGLEIQAPTVRPRVTDTATEVAARVFDLEAHGLLERLSPHRLAAVLRAPYGTYRGGAGMAMLAEADRANAIQILVGAAPLPDGAIAEVRTMRLHERLAELDTVYEDSWEECCRRARLDYLMRELPKVAEPAWAAAGSGGQRG